MSSRKTFFGLAYVMLLVSTAMVSAQDNGGLSRFVPGRILVKFKDGVSDGQARRLLAGRGALSTNVIPQIGVHIVQLPPNANEQAFMRALKGSREVESAELDRLLTPQAIYPNDLYYVLALQGDLDAISAPAAWSVTTGTPPPPGVAATIAFVDTGITAVSDLAAKMVPGWNLYDNNSNTTDVAPTGGHGTQVAGVAAASSNNSIGVAGACWGCMIMPVRVSDFSGVATLANIAAGINWAADHGARIINLGFQVTGSATVSSAAQYAATKGAIVVAPSGDYGITYAVPDDPNILEVGATDPNDVVYSWSDKGT